MNFKTPEATELFNTLVRRGFAPEFSFLIASELNTPWTATRMLGYLRNNIDLKEEEIVDEMLGIINDRNRIVQKKEMEFYQSKINEMYYNAPFGEDE